MKVIDLLNKMANGKLEDNFKFCYKDIVFTYDKQTDRILSKNHNDFGASYKVERCLNDDILLFENKEVLEDEEIDIQEIEEYKTNYSERCIDVEVREKINEIVLNLIEKQDKINEIIRVVNKMQIDNKIKGE